MRRDRKSRDPDRQSAEFADAHEYDQVIIYARRVGTPGQEWVTTYGRDKVHGAAAARIGEAVRLQVVKPIEELTARAEAAEASAQAMARELAQARREDECADAYKLVPVEPTPELLHSMAVRYDHGLGMPGYYDQPIFGAENIGHARRLEATIRTMRQLHEEVVGAGFYRAPSPAEALPAGVDAETAVERAAVRITRNRAVDARAADRAVAHAREFDTYVWRDAMRDARAALCDCATGCGSRRGEPGSVWLISRGQARRNELAELIKARLIGVDPDSQDLVLEDHDWREIVAALEEPRP